jgi:hypothetical protein
MKLSDIEVGKLSRSQITKVLVILLSSEAALMREVQLMKA